MGKFGGSYMLRMGGRTGDGKNRRMGFAAFFGGIRTQGSLALHVPREVKRLGGMQHVVKVMEAMRHVLEVLEAGAGVQFLLSKGS